MKLRTGKTIVLICIILSLLALGIGYAAVSKDLAFDAEVDGQTQNEVFITDISAGEGGTLNSSSFISTLLKSNITLNNTLLEPKQTITVTVYNSGSVPYCYHGTICAGVGEFYSNADIEFETSLDAVEGDWMVDPALVDTGEYVSVILPGTYKDFTIDFSHTGSGSDFSLDSIIKFEFYPVEASQVVELYKNVNKDENTLVARDCFLNSSTTAQFKVKHVVDGDNVARCNKNAVPEYGNDGILKITDVVYDGNNTGNTVKCELFDTLSVALTDTKFEPGKANYTVNNFLVLKNFTDDGKRTDGVFAGVFIPEDVEWNLDLAGRTVTYAATHTDDQTSVFYFFNLKNRATFNIKSTALGQSEAHKTPENTKDPNFDFDTTFSIENMGGIVFDGEYTGLVAVRNDAAVFTVTGGRYESNNDADLFTLAKNGSDDGVEMGGKLTVRNAVIKTRGDAFDVGMSSARERLLSNQVLTIDHLKNAGNAYNANLEIFGCRVTSTTGNILHTTSRQNFFCNLFDSYFVASANNVIQADDGGDTTEGNVPTGIYAYENAKIYMHYCNFTRGASEIGENGDVIKEYYHFYTHGTRMFYSARFGLSDGSGMLQSGRGGAAEANDISGDCLRIKTYYYRKTTGKDTIYNDPYRETWFYIRDVNGNILEDANGNQLRVGDEIEIMSMSVKGSDASRRIWSLLDNLDLSKGLNKQTVETTVNLRGQYNQPERRFMLLPSDTAGYYHIAVYLKPCWSIVDEGGTIKLQDHTIGTEFDEDGNELSCGAYESKSKFLITKTDEGYSFGYKTEAGVLTTVYGPTSNKPINAKVIKDENDANWAQQFWDLTIKTTTKKS